MTEAPRIETERLTLRPHRMDDFPTFATFFAGDAARFIGGPMPARQAWHGFAADVGSWELMGYGAWAIEERTTGAFAGQVALSKPPHFPEAEIGWLLMPGFEGRGYATEAALAARAFAYATLGWPTAVSYVDPENLRSIAVARRLGCTEDPAATSLDPGDIVFRHPAPGRRGA
jgi:RimJ/RimL family protein N-acetyltransferase